MKKELELPNSLKESHQDLKSRHKPWYQSRTLWVNILFLGSGFIQSVSEYYMANPEATLTVVALINLFLRFVTKHELTLKEIKGLDDEPFVYGDREGLEEPSEPKF